MILEGLVVLLLGQSYCNIASDVLEERGAHVINACNHGTLREYTEAGGFLDQALERFGDERPDVVWTDFGEREIKQSRWLERARKKKRKRKMIAWMAEFDGYLERVGEAWQAPVFVVQTGRWYESRKHRLWRAQARLRGMQASVAVGHPSVCALGSRWGAGRKLSKTHPRWPNHHDGDRVVDLLLPSLSHCLEGAP